MIHWWEKIHAYKTVNNMFQSTAVAEGEGMGPVKLD